MDEGTILIMKKILCFLVLFKFLFLTWPVFADSSINGRWLDYYEEGDSTRIDKGVSLKTKEGQKRVGAYIKTGLWTWDLSDSILTFRIKISNWRDVDTAILVVSSSGLKFEKAATFNIKQRLIGTPNDEWVEISVPKSAWVIDGDIDWSKVNSFLFAVADLGYKRIDAEIANIKVSKIEKHQEAFITISIDDGLKDTNDVFGVMQKFGYPGTAFIDVEKIDQDGYVKRSDLFAMLINGWDISGHRIGNLKQLNQDELKEHSKKAFDYLQSLGSPGAKQYALPNGARNVNISNALFENFDFIFNIYGMSNDSQTVLTSSINRQSVDKHTSLALAKKWVDDAIANKEWLIINFHTFSDDWKNEEDWSLEDFTSLLEYIQSKNVKVMSASNVLKNIKK